jgi:hypothetical protein
MLSPARGAPDAVPAQRRSLDLSTDRMGRMLWQDDDAQGDERGASE